VALSAVPHVAGLEETVGVVDIEAISQLSRPSSPVSSGFFAPAPLSVFTLGGVSMERRLRPMLQRSN
tara:strand:- start:1707 stop:1907 length:201 start_codon:yes stop_codon:yes gene_type:complete